MTLKPWTIAAALGLSVVGVTGCVGGSDRYDPGYRRPGTVVVERDRYVRDDRRPVYRDDRRNRGERDDDRRLRTADRRGGEFDDNGGYDRRDARRYGGSPQGIDDDRGTAFCRRSPEAPGCRGDRDARY